MMLAGIAKAFIASDRSEGIDDKSLEMACKRLRVLARLCLSYSILAGGRLPFIRRSTRYAITAPPSILQQERGYKT